MSKTDKFLHKALRKMFQYVGETYSKEFTKQEEWYHKCSWTPVLEQEFREWFIKTMRKDLKLNKTVCEREYSWFSLMWGWKTEYDCNS